MALVLASSTSSQAELEHAASEDWRNSPVVVDPPASEPPDTEEAEETAAASETAEETESKGPISRSERRKRTIAKLAQKANDLEAQLNEARRENEKLRARPEEDKRPPVTQPAGEPKQEQFESVEAYVKALVRWEREQADIRDQQAIEAEQRNGFIKAYNRRVTELQAEADDFDDVVNQNLSIPNSVLHAVVEMGEQGPDVAYYLGKHPEVCEELLDMTPLSAVRRIERIAIELSSKEKPNSSQEPKTRVTPPAPVRAVAGISSRSSVPLDQLTPGEYVKQRNAELAAKGRR